VEEGSSRKRIVLNGACFIIPPTKFGNHFVWTRNLSVDLVYFNTTEQISFISYIYNTVVYVLFSLKYFNRYWSWVHFLFILGVGLYL
jgi:hypothetical protein